MCSALRSLDVQSIYGGTSPECGALGDPDGQWICGALSICGALNKVRLSRCVGPPATFTNIQLGPHQKLGPSVYLQDPRYSVILVGVLGPCLSVAWMMDGLWTLYWICEMMALRLRGSNLCLKCPSQIC